MVQGVRGLLCNHGDWGWCQSPPTKWGIAACTCNPALWETETRITEAGLLPVRDPFPNELGKTTEVSSALGVHKYMNTHTRTCTHSRTWIHFTKEEIYQTS